MRVRSREWTRRSLAGVLVAILPVYGLAQDSQDAQNAAPTSGGEQLEQGQIDTFTVLRLAGEDLAAKVQLTQIRASRLRERVNLHLALGGDFSGPAGK